jgi:hypothetical protein
MTKFQAVAARFAKGFIAGGLSSVAALLVTGVSLSTMGDWANFGFALLTAFLTGGLLGVQKLYSWVE